jgi:hypothetical protein
MNISLVFACITAVAAGLSVWAVASVILDSTLTRTQKIFQILIALVIPIVGAVVVLAVRRFMSRQHDRTPGDSSLTTPDRVFIGKYL